MNNNNSNDIQDFMNNFPKWINLGYFLTMITAAISLIFILNLFNTKQFITIKAHMESKELAHYSKFILKSNFNNTFLLKNLHNISNIYIFAENNKKIKCSDYEIIRDSSNNNFLLVNLIMPIEESTHLYLQNFCDRDSCTLELEITSNSFLNYIKSLKNLPL